MKRVKLFEEFIVESVEVRTNRYERSHGKKPKGTGKWAFYFDDRGGDPIFTPTSMNYSDAVKWAREQAKKAGKTTIYVGESVNEREYSDEERKSMADKGLALPDGSFPIGDVEDLKNAIKAYGRASDQSAAAKHIAKRAKALGAEDLIPDSDDFQRSLNEANNYQIYHTSYSSAVDTAIDYANRMGYEVVYDDVWSQISVGPKRPSEGKTNRASISLTKDGKPQRKMLQMQIYGMGNGKYELNAYIQ